MRVRRAVCDQESNAESESAEHSFTGDQFSAWREQRNREKRTSIAYAMNALLQLRCQADLKGKHLRNDGFLVGGSDSGL